MKLFAVILLATLAFTYAVTDEEKSKAQALAGTCVKSSKVDKELIAKARALEYIGRDPHLANYYSCFLTKLHFQNPDGSFDTELMLAKIPAYSNQETSSTAVKKCALYDGELTNDDNAMNFVYCFYQNVGEGFKFFN